MSFTKLYPKPLRTRQEVAKVCLKVAYKRQLQPFAAVLTVMGIAVEAAAEDDNGELQYWCPGNPNNWADSMVFPHDSESDDSRSMGYLQQQPGPNGEAWWGTTENMMTLEQAADTFMSRLPNDYLGAIDNAAAAGELVANVQRPDPAYRYRYAEHWDEAWALVKPLVKDVLVEEVTGGNPAPGKATDVTTIGWTGDPVWLADVVKPAVKKFKTLPGWDQDGHGDFQDIWGVMIHHTGNANESAQSISNGRPDLAGPLANLHIAPDGTVTVVAVGVCWHAGQGDYAGIPSDMGNQHLIGIECAWPTIHPDGSYDPGERWPDAQIIAMRDTVAAILKRLGYGSNRVIGHKEYAGVRQGKWDPGNLDMGWFRVEVGKALAGQFNAQPTPPVVVPPDAPPQIKVPYSNPAQEVLIQTRGRFAMLGNRTPVEALSALLLDAGIITQAQYLEQGVVLD
jgi:hypothetical protein